jgi:hypothetical protein
MKLLIGALAAGIAGATTANATTIVVDTLPDSPIVGNAYITFGQTLTVPASGAFELYYTFMVKDTVEISVSESDSVTKGTKVIPGGVLSLNEWTNYPTITPPTTSNEIDSGTLETITKTTQGSGLGPDQVSPGWYYIELTGSSVNTATVSFNISGNVTSSSIPEPATWAMFGIGFAGIGLAGLTKRRRATRYAI